MEPIVFRAAPVSPAEFVAYWFPQYTHPLETLYTENINRPRTRDVVIDLFKLKNGGKISKPKTESIDKYYVPLIGKPTPKPSVFLESFGTAKGGAIWPIFWLHCCDQSLPVYDQHVHRAMSFIEDGAMDELDGKPDSEKINLYLTRYLQFYRRFDGIDQRQADRALWVFGKFIKGSAFPEFRHLHKG